MKTRDKILQAALELFVQNGIDKTSTAKICTQVGLSSGALFVHFNTKQDLIDELYITHKTQGMKIISALVSREKTAEENIKNISRSALSHYGNNKTEFLFVRQIQSAPIISDRAVELIEKELEWLTMMMSSWRQNKEIKNIEEQLLGDIWWQMMIAMIQKMHAEKISKPKEEWIDFIWDALRR